MHSQFSFPPPTMPHLSDVPSLVSGESFSLTLKGGGAPHPAKDLRFGPGGPR